MASNESDPALANDSIVKNPLSREWQLGISGGLMLLPVVTVTLSTLVLVVILKARDLHHPSGLMLGSAAVAHWVYGVTHFGLIIPVIFHGASCGWVIDACFSLYAASKSVCLINVTLLTVDRYVCVARPLHYLVIMTPWRIKIALIVSWLVSGLVYGLVVNLSTHRFTKGVFGCCPHFHYTFLCAFYVPQFCSCVIIFACFIHIIHILKGRLKVQNLMVKKSGKQYPSAKRMFLPVAMVSIYVLSNSPAMIFFLVRVVMKIPQTVNYQGEGTVYLITKIVDNFGYLINLLLFTFTYRPFKIALIKMFCRTWYRKRRASLLLAIEQDLAAGHTSR